jgi:tol-pal system protein YbgF
MAGSAAALGLVALLLPGCYTIQLARLQQGLDSLRVVADTLQARDSLSLQLAREARRDLDEQRDLLMGTRASTGSTSREIFDALSRLEAKLDDLGRRFETVSSRMPAPGGAAAGTPAGAVAPEAVYDQAALDLTQGRYALALGEFRQFVEQYPQHDLADNARFGAAECFFAQAQLDSAAVEYARVESDYPQGDKVPAALYKLALCYERLDKQGKAEETLQALVKRFPNSGEAQLARDRLGTGRRR